MRGLGEECREGVWPWVMAPLREAVRLKFPLHTLLFLRPTPVWVLQRDGEEMGELQGQVVWTVVFLELLLTLVLVPVIALTLGILLLLRLRILPLGNFHTPLPLTLLIVMLRM
jgi:hypothetical protein